MRLEAKDGQLVDTYVHVQAGRGVNAVAVVLEGGTEELAHDVAVHVAFTKPAYLSRDEVPADEVDAERATIEEISRNEGKPEAALPKIIEGRLNGLVQGPSAPRAGLRARREADDHPAARHRHDRGASPRS